MKELFHCPFKCVCFFFRFFSCMLNTYFCLGSTVTYSVKNIYLYKAYIMGHKSIDVCTPAIYYIFSTHGTISGTWNSHPEVSLLNHLTLSLFTPNYRLFNFAVVKYRVHYRVSVSVFATKREVQQHIFAIL